MKPKLAIIIERFDITLGGAERSVYELAGALAAIDYEVHILAAKGTEGKNVHILCGGNKHKRTSYTAFGNALTAHLSANRYDVIHSVLPFEFADVYQPRGGTYAEAIARNIAACESNAVRTFKKATAWTNVRRTRLLRAERRIARTADGPRIVAISAYVARQFREHYGTPEDRITVIPNGIRADGQTDTAQADTLRTAILTQLNLKEADVPVFFLFAAHNWRLKGLAFAIRAMRLATANVPGCPAHLLVAGRGRAAAYLRLARELGVAGRVLFLGPAAHIQNLIAISDVAILPTFYDPCSRFILEALAGGRPVITTSFNGATDLFTPDRHGKVVDSPQNIAALSAAISHFAARENIQVASQAIIDDNLREKLSVGRVARQLKALYDSVTVRQR